MGVSKLGIGERVRKEKKERPPELCKHNFYPWECCRECDIERVIESIAAWIERAVEGGDFEMSELPMAVRSRYWE